MNTTIATAKPKSGIGGWGIGSSDIPSGVGFAPKGVGGADGGTINKKTFGLVYLNAINAFIFLCIQIPLIYLHFFPFKYNQSNYILFIQINLIQIYLIHLYLFSFK